MGAGASRRQGLGIPWLPPVCPCLLRGRLKIPENRDVSFLRQSTLASWFLSRSPTLAPPDQALLCSQQGLMASLPLTCLPISPETTFQPQELRMLFLHPSLATVAPVFVHLLVWPSIWVSWPPPCSMSVGRAVGPPRILVGERSSSRLPGNRGEGSRPTSESRTWTSFLSVTLTTEGLTWWLMASLCSRERSWPSTPPWYLQSGATGRRDNNQRSSPGPSSETQRADLPRVGSATRSRSAGALGLRSGGTLVREVSPILCRTCGDQSQV